MWPPSVWHTPPDHGYDAPKCTLSTTWRGWREAPGEVLVPPAQPHVPIPTPVHPNNVFVPLRVLRG